MIFLKNRSLIVWAAVFLSVLPFISFSASETAGPHDYSLTFLWIAIILLLAKFSGLVEKIGQPSVLGELLMGILLGNLGLIGLNFFGALKSDPIIPFLAELGVVILLFQIGLESNIQQMKKVGTSAFLVAVIGVIVPFALGTFVVGPLLLKGLSFNAYLFLGATLTATSVGITARVFKDLNKIKTPEAQIVLGAAVIDDVLGLIILAVVSAIVVAGSISLGAVSLITFKAVAFLAGSVVLGILLAPKLGSIFSKINTGTGMKFAFAVSLGLIFAFSAQKIGLAPIVGAFAAGLVLDPVHFKKFKDPEIVSEIKSLTANADNATREKIKTKMEQHSEKHVEELIEPLGHFLVPVFFVMTGFAVELKSLFDPTIIFTAVAVTAAAFAGKIVAGMAAGKANKLIVGFGMIPRGEVGLIFAMMGKSLGVVSDAVYSIIIIMVILSTLFTPPALTYLLKKQK